MMKMTFMESMKEIVKLIKTSSVLGMTAIFGSNKKVSKGTVQAMAKS